MDVEHFPHVWRSELANGVPEKCTKCEYYKPAAGVMERLTGGDGDNYQGCTYLEPYCVLNKDLWKGKVIRSDAEVIREIIEREK